MTTVTHSPEETRPHEPPRKRVPLGRRRARPYVLLLPAVVLCGMVLYPFALGVYYTLFNYSAARPDPDFLGLTNYQTVLTEASFWQSGWATLVYASSATALELVLGVGVALLLNRSTVVGKVFEKLLILPLMIAPIIAAIIWNVMLWPGVGILSEFFDALGMSGATSIDTPFKAMLWCVVIDAWVFTPFVAILALAALRSMPPSPFEAAAVDGARAWFTFRTLTLPMLWPYLLVAVIFRFMDSLKMFDIIYALTAGGPGRATMTLQIDAYLQAISFQRFSFGMTFMILLWVIVYLVTMQLVRYLRRVQHDSAGK